MIYLNQNKPIVRPKTSYHDRLSEDFFQDIGKGLQPVHRTMTIKEKWFSQTKKDALAIRWAKNRLRMCLLNAPKFKINTGHKLLLSMFNKVKANLPPRTER